MLECKYMGLSHDSGALCRINRYMLECKSHSTHHALKERYGINRYMLECKSDTDTYNLTYKRELIDTCWNVNFPTLPTLNAASTGINRYMLECKSTSLRCRIIVDRRINRYMLECK